MRAVRVALWSISTLFIASAAFGQDGSAGEQGAPGASGVQGKNGSIGGIETWYTYYPLCSLASLIAAAHDENKLKEYLSASCSVTELARHTRASMFTYTITRQEPELLRLIVADPKARVEIDVYSAVPRVDTLENLPVELNAFEVTIFNRLIDQRDASTFPIEAFSNLYIDDKQIEMLQLLLEAATDRSRLTDATSAVLQRLRESALQAYPNTGRAVRMIESRLSELAR